MIISISRFLSQSFYHHITMILNYPYHVCYHHQTQIRYTLVNRYNYLLAGRIRYLEYMYYVHSLAYRHRQHCSSVNNVFISLWFFCQTKCQEKHRGEQIQHMVDRVVADQVVCHCLYCRVTIKLVIIQAFFQINGGILKTRTNNLSILQCAFGQQIQ